MPHAPIGYLIGSVVTAAITYLSLWPRPTNGPRATPTSVLAMAGSELPHIFLLLNATSTTLAITEGAPFSIVEGVALALSSLAAIGQVAVIVLASRGRSAISDSLAAAYGDVGLSRSPGWRHWLRAALAPARLRRRSVERNSAIRYGPDRATHLLDLYRARDLKAAKGFVIHFHGGGFFSGRRSKEARLLMEQLAAAGWIGISADYRLEPRCSPTRSSTRNGCSPGHGSTPETTGLILRPSFSSEGPPVLISRRSARILRATRGSSQGSKTPIRECRPSSGCTGTTVPHQHTGCPPRPKTTSARKPEEPRQTAYRRR